MPNAINAEQEAFLRNSMRQGPADERPILLREVYGLDGVVAAGETEVARLSLLNGCRTPAPTIHARRYARGFRVIRRIRPLALRRLEHEPLRLSGLHSNQQASGAVPGPFHRALGRLGGISTYISVQNKGGMPNQRICRLTPSEIDRTGWKQKGMSC